MLPFTPEGVLLREGDVRREPPIVLARRAGTPYRNRHWFWISSHIARARRANGGLVAFLGMCERADARSCWSPPWVRRRRGRGPARASPPGRRHDRSLGPPPQGVSRG